MDMSEFKALLEKQGEAFETFKTTMETDLKGKLNRDDPIVTEKLARIEKSLDDAAEAKAGIEAAIEAERKEREELEARINRQGIQADSEAEAKARVELKEFNTTLSVLNAGRNRPFDALDSKGLAEYKAAQETYMRRGKDDLPAEDVKALSVGHDADGGYFVTPDTSGRIVRKVFETSPIRQIASQQMISTDKLEGIEDLDETGVGYAGERSTSGNADTPEIGKWEIPVYWIDTEPKITQQLLDDAAVDIEAWLAGKVGPKFGRFENAEFVAGSKGKIRGFLSHDTAADNGDGVDWGKIGYARTGKAGGFADDNPADCLFDLIGLIKNEYLANARFVTRRTIITAIRKFKDGQGNYLWQPSFSMGQPEMIAGFPLTRAEDMPKAANGSLSLAFGDFREAYQIVDRQGMRTLRDNLTQKPWVKFYTTKRVGGGVVNFEAIKLLKFATR